MAAEGVIVEIDEQEQTRWVTRGDKHYPFENNKVTLFENESDEDLQMKGLNNFYWHDPQGYAEFKARQQQEQQNG